MKKLLMGVAALSLLTAGAASAETIVKKGPNQTTVVHKDRYGDRTVSKFSYKGRSWNRVRGPAWNAPRGWNYRRYAVGAYLPGTFLAPTFYVNPSGFGLALPVAVRGMGREPALDGDAGGRGVRVLQPLPGRLGGRVLAHEELHGVAVPQHGAEGRQAAVDARTDAGVRVLAVLRVGGVHACGALGEGEGAAVGPEDGDLAVLGEVLAERGPEGVGVGRAALPFEEAGEPAGAGGVGTLAVGRGGVAGGAGRRRLTGRYRLLPGVRDVRVAERDDPGLGDPVHPVGADEDFDDLAVRARDRRVQGLVQVELGCRDEVLELADHRREAGV